MKKILILLLLNWVAVFAVFSQSVAPSHKPKVVRPSDDGELVLYALDGQGTFLMDATAYTDKRSNLAVYNLQGELITTAKSEGSTPGIFKFFLDVSKRTVYFYQLIDEDNRMAGGKISIK